MRDPQTAVTFYRKDYCAPTHRIVRTNLEFTLEAQKTRVVSTLEFEAATAQAGDCPLELDGEDLKLESVVLDGQTLGPEDYTLTDTQLIIANPGKQGTLQITVWIDPSRNTRLEGLYVSNGNFFTQCEAQGFRRITYFPDRPDVLSLFTVTLIAEQSKYPVTLSNGNLIETQTLANGMHLSKWEDPFPKPAYLFALVAGRFVCQEETIQKKNGQDALLQVWVEPGNLDKTDFAMQSLKHAIEWDNSRFNLDLDLDRFMIVATSDFNMGAMENKGLNIFNTKFVFANPELATDTDFENVESVVGHEYFHNWTGNRVTCRDWFQLSLKEGLTVFRDQEFSADMVAKGLNEAQAKSARASKRIEDVKVLRAAQFTEDAGPMAHPVRPESYQEINNFYTVTVYEKGAEVIRMQHTLLGEETFQRGMALYFERHDGQAVTCEDFVCAMESALQAQHPEKDLQQFRNWYAHAGTPTVQASWVQHLDKHAFHLTLQQSCAPTPGQSQKPAFHIPIQLGLVNQQGQDLTLRLAGSTTTLHESVLDLTQAKQTFVFTQVSEKVVPSLLRNFSAPVRMHTQHSLDEWVFLAQKDSDPFNRWDACQHIYTRAIFELLENPAATGKSTQAASTVFGNLLSDTSLSKGYLALALQLPGEVTLFEQAQTSTDPVALHGARCTLREHLAVCHAKTLKTMYQQQAESASDTPYQYNALDAEKRALKNTILTYLCTNDQGWSLAHAQYQQANNMTDRMGALTCLVHQGHGNDTALDDFYKRFESQPLAIDKWFMVQATRPASAHNTEPLQKIHLLLEHPAFTLKNPNRVRAVLAGFAMQNPSVFHQHDGKAYALWAKLVIELNQINPQVAARMARALDRWTKLSPHLQKLARQTLETISSEPGLSTDVREIIDKALNTSSI